MAILLVFIGLAIAAYGQATPWRAGIIRLTVNTQVPFDVLVWYPTYAEEVPWQAGPFTIPAGRNAVFPDGSFPILLMSHGGGLTGGTPLILREIAASLARQGFVVVAPFHGKTRLRARPTQIRQALAAVLADPRFAPHLDPARLGMVGFSLGTTVALELAGAIPNANHLEAYCNAHPNDAMSCASAPGGETASAPPQSLPDEAATLPSPLTLKAIALLDPYAVLFQRPELTAVTTPILIFRPDHSELPGEANAFALPSELPNRPDFQVIPGGHFVFTDVCPDSLRATAPEVCADPPNVDREAVHREVEKRLADFFHKHL